MELLDLLGPSHAPAQEASTVPRADKELRTRVLIADDEQVIANTLAIIFTRAGFEACAAYSGEAAVQMLTDFKPDLLVSDVVMTGMTGIDAAIAVRMLHPKCRVLLFSGQASTADLLKGARSQGYDFEILTKPIHPANLLDRARQKLS